MIIIIDNYDSFVYNIVQCIGKLKEKVIIFRNDEITLKEISKLNPDGIVISPGPSIPENAGISLSIIKYFKNKIPILGICLGLQSIAVAFGAKLQITNKIFHGKKSLIYHDKKSIFKNMPLPFIAMRYHSIAIKKNTLPECFEISATTEDGLIMGIRHKEYLIEGVQFHPESIFTTKGEKILKNFINLIKN